MAGLNIVDRAELLQMVIDCERRQQRLTEWEREFIPSLKKQIQSDKTLSAAQTEKLDAIWERVTSK